MNTTASLRKQFPILARRINGQPLRYLDNAATTFSPRPVIEAVLEYEQGFRSNVQRGVHTLANEATVAYEAARAQVAAYLNAAADEVVFTSGTTASINMLAYCLESAFEPGDEVLVSLAEHHSNLVPWQRLRDRRGVTLKTLPLRDDGTLALDMDEHVSERCRLIAVTHASNVTGAVTDLTPIVAAAREVGAQVLVDGAQMAAHGPVDVKALGVDYYVLSGHKCYGPNGIGALWGRAQALAALPPFLVGGGVVERVTPEETTFFAAPRCFEAGTPPIAQAIGLAAALDWLAALPWATLRQREQQLTQHLIDGLSALAGVRILGPTAASGDRLPIVAFDIDGYHPHDICHLLDSHGLALRGGHHCAQPLLDHFDLLASSRASLGVYNDVDDVDALLQALPQVLAQLR